MSAAKPVAVSEADPFAQIEVRFEDQHLIVLNKPWNCLSQGEHTGQPNLVDWLRVRWGRPYVGLVHRLDRNTSGLMVVAKRSKSADRLSESLRSGELERRYQAWVWGTPTAAAGRWEHWLWRDEATRITHAQSEPMAASAGGSGTQTKPSALRYRTLATTRLSGQAITLLELELETGRAHQIRAQALAERLPIVGDRKYSLEPFARLHAGYERPLLHSSWLRFPHPMGRAWHEFDQAPPRDWPRL